MASCLGTDTTSQALHDPLRCPSKQLLRGAGRRMARSHRCGRRRQGGADHCVTLHRSNEAKSVVGDTDHQGRCATLKIPQVYC